MNNDKLLRAFIEASGFEVEEVRTRTHHSQSYYNGVITRESSWDTDYKVTKTKLQQGLDDNKISEPKPRREICKECNGSGIIITHKCVSPCPSCGVI